MLEQYSHCHAVRKMNMLTVPIIIIIISKKKVSRFVLLKPVLVNKKPLNSY